MERVALRRSRRRPNQPEAIWSFIEKTPEGCWLWTRNRNSGGYGIMSINHRPRLVHRVAWEVTNGPIPAGLHVCHTCDMPPCLNPAHLFLGTNAENMQDASRKGRLHGSNPNPARGEANGARTHPEQVARGERNGEAKLTAMQVAALRRDYRAGGYTYRALATRYGVSPAQAWQIVNGHAWAHITE